MSFGVTTEGFVGKRLEDIQNEIKQDIRDVFGDNVNFDPRGPWGQLVGIFAGKHSEIWELAEATYNAHYPNTAEGAQLDNVAAYSGIVRKGATKSKVVITAFGTPATVIPAGSIVSVLGNSTAKFVTISPATIEAAVNEVQKIFFSSVPDSGQFKINFNGQVTAFIAYNASTAAIESALEALSNLTDVVVTGDFTNGFTVTFQGVDGGINQPLMTIQNNTLQLGMVGVNVTVQELTKGHGNEVDIACEAQTAGVVAAPSGTLTVIETPVFGWATVNNALDADIGTNVETDEDLRTRRAETIAFPGKSTLDAIRADLLELEGVIKVLAVENVSMITIGVLPPKSMRFVIQGGDDAEIAQLLWDNKPGGIQLVGSEVEVVKDSQGFDQNVNFDRPTMISIWIDITITKDASFPLDGATQVRDALLTFGDALNIGDDIIVYPQLVCSLDKIPGIIDVVVKIGTAPSPTLDNNIAIAQDERADFDASRITVAVTT